MLVLLEHAGVKLLIDPFMTGNQLASKTAEEVEADYIFVTHGHGDHLGDTYAIAKEQELPFTQWWNLPKARWLRRE